MLFPNVEFMVPIPEKAKQNKGSVPMPTRTFVSGDRSRRPVDPVLTPARMNMRQVAYTLPVAVVMALLTALLYSLLAVAPRFERIPVPPRPNYLVGVVEADQELAQAKSLGIGWTRVPLPWSSVEPSSGDWNFHYKYRNRKLLGLAAHGIVPVGVVTGVPAWASTIPSQAPHGVPQGLSLPLNNPQNYWAQYMYNLALHYAGLINTWIIGNEITVPKGPLHSFDGTPMQMAEMIRVAYYAIKAANPAASILPPADPYWYDRGRTTDALLTDLASLPGAKQNHDFIDGLDLNLYNTLQWNGSVFGYYHRILKEHGLGTLPVWLSETNAATNAPMDRGITRSEQADFLIENLADSLAYAPHVEVYEMRTNPRGRVNYGLVSVNGSTSPAYTAVETITHALTGTRFLSKSVLPVEWKAVSQPAVVTFGGVRRLVQVVWDQGFQPTTVKLKAYAGTASVISADGVAHSVAEKSGDFTLSLAPARLHSAKATFNAPVGGPPLIVVQTVKPGQAGTPITPPENSPSEFTAPVTNVTGAPLRATQGRETAVIHPSQSTVTITYDGRSVTVGGWGTGSGQLLGPSGVAIGLDGIVYVSNSGANDVVAYSPSGHVMAEWGRYGAGADLFNGPSSIAVNSVGDVYVADTLNQRIEEFSPMGQYLASGSATWPTRVTINSFGVIAYTDLMAEGYWRRTPTPEYALLALAHRHYKGTRFEYLI